MNPWLRRSLEGIALLAVVGGGVVWLSGGFERRIAPHDLSPAATTVPPDAKRAVVERVTEPAVECASGVLESANRTTVSSRILARISEIKVSAGDRVSAADVVIRLDARDLEARVRQQRDSLHAAEAELKLARVEESRAKQLLDRGAGTRQRHDQTLSRLRIAEAEVARLTRALEEAEAVLSYAEIKTPVGGRVIDRLAEPGDVAAPGVPLLRIYDPARLRVEAPVRESLAVHLDVGNRIRVKVTALDMQMEGTIDEIVPFAEPGARTMLVKISLPPNQRLLGGMFARIFVPGGERTRLYIPALAVERIGQLEFVTVVDAAGRPEKRLVTTGERGNGNRVEVLSGLEEGETVIWHDAPSRTPSTSPPLSAETVASEGSPCVAPVQRRI